MTIRKITQHVIFAALAITIAASCKKVVSPIPMGDAGQTLVKFMNGGTISEPGSRLVSMDLSLPSQVIQAVDLRRDIPNDEELNKSMVVIIKNDPSVLTHANTDAIPLPEVNFSFDSRVEVTGDEFKVTMQPGEFALPINFNLLNADQLDLTNTYGIGFTIYSATADGKILEAQKSFVVILSSNNKWDGVYRLYGGFSRSDQLGFLGVTMSPNGYYEPYFLVTQGSSSVDPSINTADGLANTQMIYNAGTGVYTYFTGVAPRLNINPVTNAVTVTPGIAITQPSVDFTQSAAELADSKYYEDGIAGHPFADGKPTIVAHFKWTATGIDRNTKDTFVYLRPR